MRVYIKRNDLIGRYGVMTPENSTFTLNKRSLFNVKLTLLGNLWSCHTKRLAAAINGAQSRVKIIYLLILGHYKN